MVTTWRFKGFERRLSATYKGDRIPAVSLKKNPQL